MLLFNLAGFLAVYLFQRLQGGLPFNPEGLANVEPRSAFNTATSFMSNTNWQGYVGEATMSYLPRMAALTVQNSASAATGSAIALVRDPDHGLALVYRDFRQLQGSVDFIPAREKDAMTRQLHLVEDLGTRTLVSSHQSGDADDRIDAIVRTLREERITVCILGVQPVKRRGWLGSGQVAGLEIAQGVMMQSGGVDLRLVKMVDRA